MENRILKIITSRLFFIIFFTLLFSNLHLKYVQASFNLDSLIILRVDVINKYPEFWSDFKFAYVILTFIFIAITGDFIYRNILSWLLVQQKNNNDFNVVCPPPYPFDEDKLQLIVGLKHNRLTLDKVANPEWVIIDEKGLYQNLLITGTIGTGKSASAMFPFTKQLMFYKAYDPDNKPGVLILDVKGNYYKQVLEFAKEAGRLDDIVIIELNGKYSYNPLHKPNLHPLVLANRSKTVLSLFSQKGGSDSYWNDKAELLIAEAIKLCRLYNAGYVSFLEINKLVNNRSYLDSRISQLLEDQENLLLTDQEEEILNSCMEYFNNEYKNLSENTLSIIQSVVTQSTQFFADPEIKKTFCPEREYLNFSGFRDVIDLGKIVILKMNISEYRNVAKTIAAYMKLDFQSEVMQRLTRENANTSRPVVFIADEYQEFVTSTDSEYFAQSREPKCISIVATQSYTSLINSLKDRDIVRTITQNLINKIWLRTDDSFTVSESQKQLGRDDIEKVSRSISENSGDVKKSRVLGTLVSDKSSVSESINYSTQKDYVFDEKLFTQKLDVFTGICFLSDGSKILEPSVVHLQPYFNDPIKSKIKRVKHGESVTNTNISKNNDVITESKDVTSFESSNTSSTEEIKVKFEPEKSEIKINSIPKNERRNKNEKKQTSKSKKEKAIQDKFRTRNIDDYI